MRGREHAGREAMSQPVRLWGSLTAVLQRFVAHAWCALREIPGTLVEDKGLTLTIHTRRTPAALLPTVKRLVFRLVRPAICPYAPRPLGL